MALTDDDLRQARKMLDGGATYRRVGEELGVDESVVRKRLGKIGRPRGVRPAIPDGQLQAVVLMRESGMPLQGIADVFGVSRGAISSALERAGQRRATRAGERGKHLTAEQRDAIRRVADSPQQLGRLAAKLWAQRIPRAYIAAAADLSDTTVEKLIHDHATPAPMRPVKIQTARGGQAAQNG